MDFHTKSYKSPDPEVPIQSLYIDINCITQTVSLGCLCCSLPADVNSPLAWEVLVCRQANVTGTYNVFSNLLIL